MSSYETSPLPPPPAYNPNAGGSYSTDFAPAQKAVGVSHATSFTRAQKVVGIVAVVAAIALTIFTGIVVGAAALAVGAVLLLSIASLALMVRTVSLREANFSRGMHSHTHHGNVRQVPGQGHGGGAVFVNTTPNVYPPDTGFFGVQAPPRHDAPARGQSAVEPRGITPGGNVIPGSGKK